ncbi:MAG TPA: amidohydrolase [Phycisphaerales bacterium]|nr:amidohydrolase [Phycisphaerales bacterium]
MTTIDLFNARVWTGEGARAVPSVVRITDGRVQAIDPSNASLRDGVRALDVEGRVLTPGLVDAHLHLTLGGQTLLHVDLSAVDSREAFEGAIEAAHANLPPSQWLIASGWNEFNWPGQARPDRSWLASAGDRPVVCWRCDWHAAVVNSAVLKKLSLPSDEVVAAAGGHVGRDRDGCLDGWLAEAAAWKWMQPVVPELDDAQRGEALRRGADHLVQRGITSVRAMEYQCDIERDILPLADLLPLRMSLVQLDRVCPLRFDWHEGVGNTDRLRLTGCKSFFDGTLGSRTARLRTDYHDTPGVRGDWLEHALHDQDQEWCQQVVEHGLSPVIHAIGDAAVGRAASLLAAVPDALHGTLEHCQVVSPEDLELLGGIRVSIQPTHRAVDADMTQLRLGQTRSSWVLPMADMVRAGARLSLGTDWPIVSADPLLTLRAAITGEDQHGKPFHASQSLSPDVALRAATIDASEAIGLPAAMQVGGQGDFVIWHGDPLGDITTASIHSTWVDAAQVAGEDLSTTCNAAEASEA